LVKDKEWDNSKYQGENRLEEAAIVSKLIHEEKADAATEYDES
jgi:hypothetical protein